MRPRVLIPYDWYLPGYKAGGVLAHIANMVEVFGDSFLFYVHARDRDITDKQPYPQIETETWLTVGKARVLYTSRPTTQSIRRRILEVDPHIIYLQGFFCRWTIKVLALRRLSLLPPIPIILAPHGEFSPGAMSLKATRKRGYRRAALTAGLYRDLLWQATSPMEEVQICNAISRSSLGPRGEVVLAPVVPGLRGLPVARPAQAHAKAPGTARFVFLSRISRKKNLDLALELLRGVSGNVQLDIYGPIEDEPYWKSCQDRVRNMPGSVRVQYKGHIARAEVPTALANYDFLILPTMAENFCYVILEALSAGCPVLISDQTPWRGLSQQAAGWDLPLEDRARWQEVIQQCVAMSKDNYGQLAGGARAYFDKWVESSPFRQSTMELFARALERNGQGKTFTSRQHAAAGPTHHHSPLGTTSIDAPPPTFE